jgi:peptidoglycan/LPS O-acetylase OafA/YrhL
MPKYLSSYINSRDNNFNLLRFIAASLVLYSHSYALTQSAGEPLVALTSMSFGAVAVDLFFITSGLLVTKSLFDRKDIVFFVWSRVLRIYPGLIVAVLFCVFVVGVYYTTLPLDEYFKHPDTYQFLSRNFTLLNGVYFNLPGVFENNPWKSAVNGSLWTLPREIYMYCVVAIGGFFLYLKPFVISEQQAKCAFSVIFLISIGWFFYHFAFAFPEGSYHSHLSRFSTLFFAGAIFYVLADRIVLSLHFFLIAIIVLVLISLSNHHSAFFVSYFLLIGYIILYLAYIPAGVVRTYNKFGDYSYGMYIYAFPVQQSIAASIPSITVAKMATLSFLITLALAVLSWHCVEKPMLSKKHVLSNLFNKMKLKRIG